MSMIEGVLESLLSLKPQKSTKKDNSENINFLDELLKLSKENPKTSKNIKLSIDTNIKKTENKPLTKEPKKSNNQHLQNPPSQITQEEILKILNTSTQLQTLSKEEKLEFTKKIVESEIKLKYTILNEKETKEFQNIKSFKELIAFADKKKLNIKKIIIEHSKNNTSKSQLKINSPKPKIATLNLKKTEIPKHQSQNKKSNSLPSALSVLLQKDSSTKKHPQLSTKNSQENTENFRLNSLEENMKNTDKNFNKPDKIEKTDSKETKNQKPPTTHLENRPQNVNIINELKTNIKKARETIKHFATSLQKSIEEYKPPISKISIEMNPKEIGKVEVTLIHRGDNLQIQINSNNTAINLLNTHQQELKQNLINMGYNEVNMSFNSNSQNQQQKHNNQNQQKKYTQEDEELIIEIPYQYA